MAKLLSKYSKNDKIQTNNIYDKYILECLDNCYYEPWINEGITKIYKTSLILSGIIIVNKL